MGLTVVPALGIAKIETAGPQQFSMNTSTRSAALDALRSGPAARRLELSSNSS